MSKTAILAIRVISDAKGAVSGLNEAEGAVGGFQGKLAKITPGALAVGGAVVTGVVAAGKALYDLGVTFDEVEDTIRTGTGATGDALEGLVDTAHAVATSIPTDFETAGSTVADLNTRMGLSGEALQTVASQYLEAGRILGEDVDIKATSAAFSAFAIEGEAVSVAMDDLFRVSQATGVGMNDLAGSAQKNAGALQEMGFTFTDSIALIGGLDKAGIDADATLNAMRKGLVNLAKPGQDMGSAFYEVTDKINAFIQAGDNASAVDLASQVFGTKGATQMVQALQTGLINTEDLSAAIGATGDTILGVGQDTMDAAEKWQILKNKGMEALEPLASAVFSFAGDALGGILDWVDTVDFSGVTNAIAAAGPAIEGFGEGIGAIAPKIMPVISTIQGALIPVIEFLAPIASNVITMIVGVLTGALQIIQGIFNVIKGIFTGDWATVWAGVGQIVQGAISIVTSYITGLRNTIASILSGIVSLISGLWSSAWTWFTTAVSNGVTSALTFIRALPGQALSALSNIGTTLLNAGRNLIQGFIDGITGMIGSVRDTLTGLTDKLTSWKGPEDKDKTLLTGAGQLVIKGFINGLESQYPKVHKTLKGLTAMVGATNVGTIAAPTYAGDWSKPWNSRPDHANTAPVSIEITVNGALDPVAVAEQIRRILAATERRTGAVIIGAGR